MTLEQALQSHLGEKSIEEYQLQVNYKAVPLHEIGTFTVDDGDIVRLSKKFEVPIQFIVGEDEDGI